MGIVAFLLPVGKDASEVVVGDVFGLSVFCSYALESDDLCGVCPAISIDYEVSFDYDAAVVVDMDAYSFFDG